MIAKAKTLNGETVEGYYTEIPTLGCNVHSITTYWIDSEIGLDFIENEIDPQTLEYQIGKEWYSMETLEHITENLDIEYLPKNSK